MNIKKPSVALPLNKIEWITDSQFETVCYNFAKEHLEFKQPIPAFATRSTGVLESCLSAPFQTFDGVDLYPSFLDKLSILVYLLIKNHPFINGNKRIALVTMLVILEINKLWLDVPWAMPYKLVRYIARSDGRQKDRTIAKIKRFLKKHIVHLG